MKTSNREKKYIEVLVRVPVDDFLTEHELGGFLNYQRTFRGEVQKAILTKAVRKIFKELKLPKVEITREEFKKAVLEKAVNSALDDDIDAKLEILERFNHGK